jgi:hypothetical protein
MSKNGVFGAPGFSSFGGEATLAFGTGAISTSFGAPSSGALFKFDFEKNQRMVEEKPEHMHPEQAKKLMKSLCDEGQTNEEKLRNHLRFRVAATSYIAIRHDHSTLEKKVFNPDWTLKDGWTCNLPPEEYWSDYLDYGFCFTDGQSVITEKQLAEEAKKVRYGTPEPWRLSTFGEPRPLIINIHGPREDWYGIHPATDEYFTAP